MEFRDYQRIVEASQKFIAEEGNHLGITPKALAMLREFPTFSEFMVDMYSAIMSDDPDFSIIDAVDDSNVEEFRNAITGLLRTAHEVSPSNVRAILKLGFHNYAWRDETDEAIKNFEEALPLARHQLVETYAGLANCYLEKGRFEENQEYLNLSREYCESILALDDHHEEALEIRQDILEILGRLKK